MSALLIAACAACHPAPPKATVNVAAPPAAWPPLDEAFLTHASETMSFRLGMPIPVAIAPDGAVLYRRTGARDRRADLFELAPDGTSKPVTTAEALLGGGAEKLSDEERLRRERVRSKTTGIGDVSLSRDGARALIAVGERVFVLERATGKTREVAVGEGFPFDARISPDGARVSFVRDGDLWVVELAGGAPRRLTKHPEGEQYGIAEFVAQEEFRRTQGYWWAPDSQTIVFQRSDLREVDTLYVSDPRHPDRPVTPLKYPRPGTPNAVVDLGILSVRGGAPRWVHWDLARYPYLNRVSFSAAGPMSLLVMNRVQTESALLALDLRTGKTETLLETRDDAWVEDPQGSPTWLEDGTGFLWLREDEAGNALALHDRAGKLVREVLPPAFGTTAVLGVSPDGTEAVVAASADPRESHVFRVALDGQKPPVALTAGGGSHTGLAKHGVVAVASALRDGGVRVAVHHPDGRETELPSQAERPSLVPTTVLETVEAEGRSFHTAITRPRDFDPKRRYPVLLRVYGGPSQRMVMSPRDGYLLDQWYADAGFIVLRADGRGTPGRGRSWERATVRDLITVPMADQVAALGAMVARHPECDAARVGVFGWSFGGYFSAMAVLLRPDVFKAAIAGSPVTDWSLYDTAYTERYMKLPSDNADGYARTSALTYAKDLRRPLLLMHGLTDDNVHFAHSLALNEALFAAGKTSELIAVPFTHMIADPKLHARSERVQVEFFRRHLAAP
ncbi:MAG: DPP IV N-terminal domain-containing protein [Polyangiales bacterium]